jgi:hypothetical protein
MLINGGMMLFTCATIGRDIHGPGPIVDGSMYYKNIKVSDIVNVFDLESCFSSFLIESEMVDGIVSDVRFMGIKR